MKNDIKRLLIIDDSEIDREILKNILNEEFEISETDNGYSALEIISEMTDNLDAILLDLSMPVLDGFGVLHGLKEIKNDNIPVFLITAEATQNNVEKAAQYGISEFIRKPFDKDDILRRLKSKLGMVVTRPLTDSDFEKTNKYIASLTSIYKRYFANYGIDSEHYTRVTKLMEVLLNYYSRTEKGSGLDSSKKEIICKASYFYDIGNIVVPNSFKFRSRQEDSGADTYQSHTTAGADIIRLNDSMSCEFFVWICSDMCLHHHERYDGTGYPHRIYGNNNSVFTQMCRLADEFDTLFYKYREHNELQFDFVTSELAQDKGAIRPDVFSLLTDSKLDIVACYNM